MAKGCTSGVIRGAMGIALARGGTDQGRESSICNVSGRDS